MHRIIFLFFFLSGFSSLVFEIIWARMLQQVFGTTSFAISTLLTAFMAGLALGSYLGGRLADRFGDQLRLYGILEGAIGAYALLVPLLLAQFPVLYGLLFEHFISDFYLFSLLRFVAVFAVLVVPTTLMGATLPLVSQWLADRQRLFQGSIGVLYGANTFGACTGCLLAGFILLPSLGLSLTNSVFASLNFALCAVVLLSARHLDDSGESTPEADDKADDDIDDELLADIGGSTARAASHPRWALVVALIAFGLTGVVSMSYQVLWTRAYLLTLGSSTYSFTLVLTAVLIGIALGSAVMSPFLKKIARPLFWFAAAQFGVAATATLSFFTLNRVPLWLFERIREPITTSAEIYVFQFGLVALVVFLPSFLQGMSFPLVIRAVTSRSEDTGSDVGNAYAFNTTGAIIGSFAAGFILMPWLGLQQAIVAVIVVNLILAGGLTAVEVALRRRMGPALFLGAGATAALIIFWVAPPLDQTRLTSGVFRAEMARDVLSAHTFENRNPEILYYEDGLTATTSVEKVGDTITLRANAKPEASDGADMPTQVMVGILPFIIRSGYADLEIGDEKAAMIGYGSGVTAGASLQWPLRQLDVIEIEATMIEASRFFDHANHRPLDDERLQIIESDGRNYVEYSPETYDIIISEPSNPWIAGVSSLFTVEYFERANQRLNDGGIYAQWVQLYELRPENVRTVFETFQSVFDHVQAFSSRPKSTDIILIGSQRPLPFPAEGYRRAFDIDSVQNELKRIGIDSIYDLYGLLFMNQQQLSSFSQGARLNTDDNGLLEFSAPRDVLFYDVGRDFFTDWYFNVDDYGDPRPYLDDWPDGDQWTPHRITALTRSVWVAGKPDLARQLLTDIGLRPGNSAFLESAPEPIHQISKVVLVAELDLTTIVDHFWPTPQSEIHRSVRRALIDRDYRRRVLDALTDLPTDDDQRVEQELFHAVLLAAQRDYRSAERLLDGLHDTGQFDDEPAFQFVRGAVLQVRRRYSESFDAYERFSTLSGGEATLEFMQELGED